MISFIKFSEAQNVWVKGLLILRFSERSISEPFFEAPTCFGPVNSQDGGVNSANFCVKR